MAKMVIGTNKNNAVPAIIQTKGSVLAYVPSKAIVNGVLRQDPAQTTYSTSPATSIGDNALAYAFAGSTAMQSADLSSLTTINGADACYNAFKDCTGLTSAILSALTTIGGSRACTSMFEYCTGLTSINLPSLTTINGMGVCDSMFMDCLNVTNASLSALTTINGSSACTSMFSNCMFLETVTLPALTTVSGYYACRAMFYGCHELASINLPALTTINGRGACYSMFEECAGLTSVKMNALNSMPYNIAEASGKMFAGCVKLGSLELGGLTASTFATVTNQFQYLFDDQTGSTASNGCTVHFPSNFDPDNPNKTFDITTLAGYPTFGGGAQYIHLAYDMPASE